MNWHKILRERRGRTTVAVAIAAAAWLGLTLGTAHAGTYSVYACKIGQNLKPAPFDSWQHASAGAEAFDANYCPQGGSRILFQRANQPHPSGDRNELVFTAPAGTTIFAYSVWRSARIMRSSSFDYAYTLSQGTRSSVLERCSGKAGCAGVGNPDDPLGKSNEIWQYGLRGVRHLWFTIGCAGSATCGRLTTDSPTKLWIHRADIHLEDPAPPSFTAAPSGPLVSSPRPVGGTQRLAIAANDVGGGVREAIAEIDGRQVSRVLLDPNGGACTPPYTRAAPCKGSVAGTLPIDTTSLADGQHTLRVHVTDATDTNTATWGPVPIRIENGCRLAPRTTARKMRLRIAVRRRGRVRAARSATFRYGRKAVVSGKLRTASGSPIAGADVCVVARAKVSGARKRTLARVRTDATGRFAAAVPRGPSRRIYAVHRSADGSAVAKVRTKVRASVRLRARRRALRNGQVLPLRGRVAGGPWPERGVVVEMQAWVGTRWQTFGTTRTRRKGRFRYRYEFRRSYGVHRYRMRARVPNQSGYPYAGSVSRRVSVVVRG